MFDHAQRRADTGLQRSAQNAAASAAAIAQLGFDPPLLYGTARSSVCGLSLPISVRSVLAGAAAARDCMRSMLPATGQGLPVCLVPEDFPGDIAAIEAWRRFCETLKISLTAQNLPSRQIAFCMHSHRMPLEAYCFIADSVLGRGSRHVFLDNLQMNNHCDKRIARRTEANWTYLWRQRHTTRPILPVYGGLVRSACKLLADEVATAPVAALSLLAPAGSAWLPVGLPVQRFCTAAGRVEWQRLETALRQMVPLADRMFDQVDWHDAGQRADALANRRLAVHLYGLGEVLVRRKSSPATLSSLASLTELVTTIKTGLTGNSARLASVNGALPALQTFSPVGHWKQGAQRERWQRHWDAAVRQAGVRNRNLLVMSPASILPTSGNDGARYADLLPLLAYADAWCFSSNGPMPGWSLPDFSKFHRRARATIQGSQRTSFVAAGV